MSYNIPLKPEIKTCIEELSQNCYIGLKLDVAKLLDKLISEGLLTECLSVKFTEKDTLSGAIELKNNKFTIYVNKEHHINRQRFTICHEIGHLVSYQNNSFSKKLIDNKGGLLRDLTEPGSLSFEEEQAELEADKIAATLLMPQSHIKQLLQRKYNPLDIARELGVSSLAVSIRLRRLGLRTCLEEDKEVIPK